MLDHRGQARVIDGQIANLSSKAGDIRRAVMDRRNEVFDVLSELRAPLREYGREILRYLLADGFKLCLQGRGIILLRFERMEVQQSGLGVQQLKSVGRRRSVGCT